MSHRTLKTSAGIVVNHSHPDQIYGELTAQQISNTQAYALANYSGIQPVNYVHLNHSSEVLLPTRRYNCWGFTFNPRQCWISWGTDVQNILNANGTQVFPPNLRLGDVICYRDNENVITHTGRVWSTDASGQATLIQSKWGEWGEYLHAPLTVPSGYGTNVTYWRVTPLTGKGDAWHKDNAADDRLPYPPGVRWLSPDLWCNNSGSTAHQDPARGQPNKLYARLHNPDTLPINNATIRFYWADPNGGIPHSQWHDIGTASVSVSLSGSAVAGPVTWIPDTSVPAHSCLLAIADTGDDPFAATTLDPIVWPFDIARDNNIIQRNISVVMLPPTPSPEPEQLLFKALNPFPMELPIEVYVDLRRVDPKDLGILGLDWQDLIPFLEGIAKRRRRLHRVIRPRPAITLEVRPDSDSWRFKGGRVSARGMVVASAPVPFGRGGYLRLMLTPTRAIQPGQIYRIDLEQRVGGEVTGGMTYVVVVDAKGERQIGRKK
jgi:hypothetical protein